MSNQPSECTVENCPVPWETLHHHVGRDNRPVLHGAHSIFDRSCLWCNRGHSVVINTDPYKKMFVRHVLYVGNGAYDTVYECNVCKALVFNRGAHVDWHATSHTWGVKV